MEKITDNDLLEELQRRFEENKRALSVIKVMNTKLEGLNEKLTESEKLKSHFLSNIRNEIVNPLSSILGLAESMIAGDASAGNCPNAARMIHMEASRLDFQLQNIFAAAEIEAGEVQPSLSHTDVGKIVSDVVEAQKYHAQERDVSVLVQADDSARNFITDPQKLERILANLVSNAIEFNREGGGVQCRVERDTDLLVVTITDEGPGIGGEDMTRIFDRFGQLETGTTKPHKGHGLGLSVTKALVEILNGTVTVESGVGFGSTFTVTLPQMESGKDVQVFSEHGREFIFEEEGEIREF